MGGRLRIATRGSALALAQAELVAGRLAAERPDLELEITVITVNGDRPGRSADEHLDSAADERAVPPGADKRRWVAEIEQALLDSTVDIAVHSAKDVPGELAPGLALLGAPPRGPAHDALCGADSIEALRPGARVGTSSVRRAAQLRAARADLEIVQTSGNVDTRLRKLETEARWDGIVVGLAGLQRLGREEALGAVLDEARFVPAPGQGTLALEGRVDDRHAAEAAEAIGDPDTFACLRAERALAVELQADCHTPLGAYAQPAGCGCLVLHAWVGLPDGSRWCSDQLLGGFYDPEALGGRMAERLRAVGALELLRAAREMAAVGA
jgi:hydroxymethylbilane synthase